MNRSFIRIFLLMLLLTASQSSCKSDRKNSVFTDLAKDYVLLLVDNEYTKAENLFGSPMRGKMKKGGLELMWNETVSKFGRFKRMISSREERIDKYTIIYIKCDFEVTKLDIKIMYDNKMKVMDFAFIPGENKVGIGKWIDDLLSFSIS